MIQRKLNHYLGEDHKLALGIDKEILKKLKRLADKHSIQYALLWYIYIRNRTTLRELYKAYRYISGKLIRENTVRKQLQVLERKGLIKKIEDSYITLVDPREVVDLFDRERAKTGRTGATIKHLKIRSKSLKISQGLAYYTKQIMEEVQKLIRRGKRVIALDLIIHTLLPLRENAVLWLWHKNVFIYYEPKVKQFRAIKSEEIARLLHRLGFTEGIMILHVLGHAKASEILRKIFSRGPYSWPWARSISYGLKQLGLLQEVDTLYKIQLKKLDNRIELVLWDLYTREQIWAYTISWKYETPEPLKNKTYYVGTVLGKPHVKQEIEEDSYFSKWKRY